MVQMEQADELVQEPQMAQYFVQDATGPVCPLECMPGLLIAHIILKSRMNREVHVRFREEQGVKSPLLTRLSCSLFCPLYMSSMLHPIYSLLRQLILAYVCLQYF